VAMPGMRWIERAAKQPDTHASSVAEPRELPVPGRRVQGRTCPVPMTR
jgi:hypothetical protein